MALMTKKMMSKWERAKKLNKRVKGKGRELAIECEDSETTAMSNIMSKTKHWLNKRMRRWEWRNEVVKRLRLTAAFLIRPSWRRRNGRSGEKRGGPRGPAAARSGGGRRRSWREAPAAARGARKAPAASAAGTPAPRGAAP